MTFMPLTPADYPRLKSHFADQRYPICVYSLSSLLAWSNEVYQPYGLREGDTLIVSAEYAERPRDRHLILPISPSREFSPEDLHSLARGTGFDTFWFVPDTYIRAFGEERVASRFEIMEQEGFGDYIYRAENLAYLRGNRFSKKRNLIHQFKREYLDTGRVRVRPLTAADAEACLAFLDHWCRDRECDLAQEESLSCEYQAVVNTFSHLDTLEVEGLVLCIDAEVAAFGVFSHLTPQMGVLHFEKAHADIKGLYQYFDSLCAQELVRRGYTFINKESDMGVPGLAKAKKSYLPERIVASYKLTVRN